MMYIRILKVWIVITVMNLSPVENSLVIIARECTLSSSYTIMIMPNRMNNGFCSAGVAVVPLLKVSFKYFIIV